MTSMTFQNHTVCVYVYVFFLSFCVRFLLRFPFVSLFSLRVFIFFYPVNFTVVDRLMAPTCNIDGANLLVTLSPCLSFGLSFLYILSRPFWSSSWPVFYPEDFFVVVVFFLFFYLFPFTEQVVKIRQHSGGVVVVNKKERGRRLFSDDGGQTVDKFIAGKEVKDCESYFFSFSCCLLLLLLFLFLFSLLFFLLPTWWLEPPHACVADVNLLAGFCSRMFRVTPRAFCVNIFWLQDVHFLSSSSFCLYV